MLSSLTSPDTRSPTENGSEITAHIRAMQLSDSVLPVGSFAFSNGLESALQTGIVCDEESLKGYALMALRQSTHSDAVAMLHAYRASHSGEYSDITIADMELWSRRFGEEQQLMTSRMGKKLAELSVKFIDSELICNWLSDIKSGSTPGCYPIGLGIVSEQMKTSETHAFAIHQYGVAAMILGAAVRLMRIDHYQTQRILYELNTQVENDYQVARNISLNQMHGFAPVFDVLVGHHVDTNSRLFMS